MSTLKAMTHSPFYHLGFGQTDLPEGVPNLALISGDPNRAKLIAQHYLSDARTLSENRGLNSYIARLSGGQQVLSTTSGMGAPSLSIVVNELYQLGVRTILRVGTCGSIQPHVRAGSVVISSAALCRQGAASDIAPPEYPAVGDPFVAVALVEAARQLNVEHHLGITASVDTFFEGQERTESSANSYLLRHLQGVTEEYRQLKILNYEMEAGTLFKMGSVYGFAAGCVCGVVAERTDCEQVRLEQKEQAVDSAIRIVIRAAERLSAASPAPASSAIDWDRLAATATRASQQAHCPYSHFRVGAALLADDGNVYSGCNVENVSYGLTICAERNAVFQMVAAGGKRILAVTIYTPTELPSAPCGACRQVMREFADTAAMVLSVCDSDQRLERSLTQLLPDAFGPENLAT